MIQTHELSKRYGDSLALDRLSVCIEPGEILGFLGPNGAGKSTTVRILTGMTPPSAGTARVAGFDVGTDPLEVKRRIGYVPETAALYDGLTAVEYLDLIRCLHHLDRTTAEARWTELLDLFGLTASRHQRLAEYSKGMRQKVLIISALLHRPDVLFLDEPFDGLDANAAAVMKELLRQLAAQGRTILFCSHILEVVERVCSRILVINGGRQVAEGTAAAIRAATGTTSLDEAFRTLTGVRDAGQVAGDVLAALDRT